MSTVAASLASLGNRPLDEPRSIARTRAHRREPQIVAGRDHTAAARDRLCDFPSLAREQAAS